VAAVLEGVKVIEVAGWTFVPAGGGVLADWGADVIKIGFTWEHPAHLYFRRAKASQLMFGGPGFYFEHLLHRSGL
jgi:crotonobetainyl-CoA:carnitine CoA-transferase CaiB-like acyl-CoA transferase